MNARLTPTQHTALRNLQRALYNDADWVGTSVDRHDGTAHRTRVDDRDAMRFLADALGDALDTDDACTLEPDPQQTAEQAATTIGRRALQKFLDQIHQPGVSSAIGMYASKNTGGQAVTTTTATTLQNLLDDANLATPAPAAATDMGITLNRTGLTNFLNEAAIRGHRGITLLASGTPTRPSVSAYITVQTLRTALQDEPDTEPETKPTDLGMATDPDPYGIDLRGPHGTLTGADRATLGGLHDLDPRTRAIFEQLLRITLTNLDRQAPTQTVIRAGNR